MVNKQCRNCGFTLIELSVVLIIIGLVISGIAAGTSLVKQAKLKSVVSEMDQFNTAYRNFKDRYQAVPGDMSNAYSLWGAKCTSGGSSFCNGNGNGVIEYSSGSANEVNKAWK